MKKLLLMRHAQSPMEFGLNDFDRPLSDQGRAQARAIGAALKSAWLVPGQILCSAAIRTRQTAAEVGEYFAHNSSVAFEESLYNARVETLLEHIQEVDVMVNIVIMIAHNPGIYELAIKMAGRDAERLSAGYAPATVSVFDVNCKDWSDLSASKCTLDTILSP